MMKKNVLVELKNIDHSFSTGPGQPLPVLDDINLKLYENEIVCLVGRSGSGKSTLLQIISGLFAPTHGSVKINGKRVHAPLKGVSVVFQNFALFPWLTVLDNVELGLEAQNIDPREGRALATESLQLMGLEGHDHSYPRELSGGMQQRVGLARALVVKPFLLLMDEPFSALDILTAEILRNDLLDLWIKKQMTCKSILTVTHNIEEAVAIADRIIVLSSNPGQIIAEFHVHLPHPRHRFDTKFRDLVDDIYENMTTKEMILEEKKRKREKLGIDLSLPWVPARNLRWLMEIVASKHKDAHDLSELAITYSIHYKDLLNIASVLQLLEFCDIQHEQILLTAHGKKFVEAASEDRPRLFREALLKNIRLASHILQILKHQHRPLPIDHVYQELERHLPAASMQETLRAVTSWARYADLFDFNEQKQIFKLTK